MPNIFRRIYITFSRITPSFYKKKIARLIKYSGKKNVNQDAVSGEATILALLSILIGWIASTMYNVANTYETVDGITVQVGLSLETKKLIIIGIGVIIALLIYFIIHFYYYIHVSRRRNFVEKVLPDALFLISSNLKSGSTPFHAVKSSIRPDFGPLAEAFDIATSKSLGTKSFDDSIVEVGDEIDSEILARSMKLFSSAIKSGSKISTLLDTLARDIIDRQTLKKELITNTKTNSMFIYFMVVVGAPFLMSVSIFFVDSVGNIQESSGLDAGDTAAGFGGMGGAPAIDAQFLTIYAYIFLFLTGFMASYFAGIMVEGNGKDGLKKAPLIVGGSYLVFFIAQFIVRNMLGGLF